MEILLKTCNPNLINPLKKKFHKKDCCLIFFVLCQHIAKFDKVNLEALGLYFENCKYKFKHFYNTLK